MSEGTEEYIGGGEAEARDGGAVVSVKAAAGEVEAEPVRPIVPFDACVARLAASETIEFRNGSASKTVRCCALFQTHGPNEARKNRGWAPRRDALFVTRVQHNTVGSPLQLAH